MFQKYICATVNEQMFKYLDICPKASMFVYYNSTGVLNTVMDSAAKWSMICGYTYVYS